MNNAETGVTESIFNKVFSNIHPINTFDDYGQYMIDLVHICQKEAREMGKTTNSIGNMTGDWLERAFRLVMEFALGSQRITVNAERAHKISEIQGFEKVTWIPYPDAIVINEKNFKGAISIKWGMRHDRMYEGPYSAYAIKDWMSRHDMTPANYYMITNDDSPARLAILLNIPVIDGVFHLNPDSIQKERHESELRRLGGVNDLINQLRLLT